MTVTNTDGCEPFKYDNCESIAIPAISGDLEICDGETTTLTASGGTSYEWEYRSNHSKYQRKSKYNNDIQRDSNECGRL
ncbi:MAG: hypothetical protein R2766_02910 [Saprospiraceae bacterium]